MSDNGNDNGNSEALKKLMGGLLDCADELTIGLGKAWITYSNALADFFGVETKVKGIKVKKNK